MKMEVLSGPQIYRADGSDAGIRIVAQVVDNFASFAKGEIRTVHISAFGIKSIPGIGETINVTWMEQSLEGTILQYQR